MRAKFVDHRDLQHSGDDGDALSRAAQHRDVEREVIAAQREAIIALREVGEIDNVVMRRVQADLDLAASRSTLSE